MNFQRNSRPVAPVQGTNNYRMHTVGNGVGGSCAVNPAGDKKNHGINNSLAMVYAPYQTWRGILDAETALCKGTIFKELVKPFCPCGKGVQK